MKFSKRLMVGAIAALGLCVAAGAAIAHPGGMGPGGMGMGPMGMGMGPRAMHGGMGPGPMGMGPAAFGPAGAAQQLMTPEERTALQDKIRNAATPEERLKIMQATRTEMEKRAQDKGITLPVPRGPRAGFGPNLKPVPQAPATTEQPH